MTLTVLCSAHIRALNVELCMPRDPTRHCCVATAESSIAIIFAVTQQAPPFAFNDLNATRVIRAICSSTPLSLAIVREQILFSYAPPIVPYVCDATPIVALWSHQLELPDEASTRALILRLDSSKPSKLKQWF